MHILVVEDETMVARNLCRMINEVLEDRIACLDHVYSIDEAEDYIADNPIDLMFLDLNLSGDNGFDLLSTFVTYGFQTIIVSANTDEALRSYDYGVLDFVPKPINLVRLATAIGRVDTLQSNAEAGRGSAKFLGVRSIGNTRLIKVSEIAVIRASGRYSQLVQSDGAEYLHEKKLKQLLLVLPELFQRIHKSHIVNLNFASKVISRAGSKYELQLKDGSFLAVGRKYLAHLRQQLA